MFLRFLLLTMPVQGPLLRCRHPNLCCITPVLCCRAGVDKQKPGQPRYPFTLLPFHVSKSCARPAASKQRQQPPRPLRKRTSLRACLPARLHACLPACLFWMQYRLVCHRLLHPINVCWPCHPAASMLQVAPLLPAGTTWTVTNDSGTFPGPGEAACAGLVPVVRAHMPPHEHMHQS